MSDNIYLNQLNSFRRGMEYIKRIGTLLVSNRDLVEVLDELMDLVLDAMKADAGSLLIVDDDNPDELVFRVTKGLKAAELKGYRIPTGVGIAGWVAQNQRPLIVPVPHADKRYCECIERKIDYEAKNLLCVPVYVGGRIYGVIEVVNRVGEATYDQEDLQLLQTISHFASIVIQNMELQQNLVEEARKLQVLIDNTRKLVDVDDREKLILKLVQSAARLMSSEAASLMLKEGDELVFHVVTGSAGSRLKNFKISVEEGIAGHVVRTGDPVLVKDVSADPRFLKRIDEEVGFQTRSMVCVPVRGRDSVLGVLQVINNSRHPEKVFQEADLDYLATFADHCALALERSFKNL